MSGIAFVLQDPIIRPSMLAVATINLFTFAFGALFILYVTATLGVSPGALGLALGIGAVGGLIGAVVASRIGRRIGLGPAYALGCVIYPLSLLTVPLATPEMSMPVILALILASEFGAGLGVMILDINIGSINNARIPDAAPGAGQRGVPVHQLRRPADRGDPRRVARNGDRRARGPVRVGPRGVAWGVLDDRVAVLHLRGAAGRRDGEWDSDVVGDEAGDAGDPGRLTNRPGPTILEGRPRR